jgi:hypothetical protein
MLAPVLKNQAFKKGLVSEPDRFRRKIHANGDGSCLGGEGESVNQSILSKALLDWVWDK